MRVPTSITSAAWRAQAWTFLSAVGLGGLIVLLRVPLQAALGPNAPFVTAWPGIIVAAFMGGFAPAVLVTLAGVAVALWVLDTAGAAPLGHVGLGIYAAFGLVFATAGGMRKRALRRAKIDAQRLADIQTQMIQVARLNTVGELAGSLAHELNQPLTAIANYLNAAEQLLGRDEVQAQRVGELVRKAGEQAVRAGQIVSRVRSSVDRGQLQTEPTSAAGLVQEAVEMAAGGAGREALTIRYDFDRDADRVVVDRIQVQQVVLNLVRNAIEAMEGRPRRELLVASRVVDPEFLQVQIADTGPGISPELNDRLFQPFVSGKPEGMGVGLSISRSIVEAHGGRMWSEGNTDGGATFHFTLRRIREEA